MAKKANKYCAVFPCSNMAEAGSSYCQEHRPARAPKETDPFYLSVQWRRFREWYIGKHPLCEQCGRPADMVDHITEIQDGGALTSEDNAMSMCWKCHALKTAQKKNHRKSGKDNRPVSGGETY